MNKFMKTAMMSLGMAAVAGAFAPNASAQALPPPPCAGCSDWTLSPDAQTLAFGAVVNITNGNTVDFSGNPTGNYLETGSQPAGIYGAGFTLAGSNFTMKFDSDLWTWDSYNATFGYYDAFIVTVSTSGYYWNSSPSDPVPVNASTFVWGGLDWSASHTLEHYNTAPGGDDAISLLNGSPTTFYVSVVLDTSSSPNTDSAYPSWGSFHVAVVPEPETYAMLLAGLGLMGFVARRRKQKLAIA